MSETLENTEVENEVVEEEVSYTPEEQMARSQGWVSKDEWVDQGKDEDSWVNATVFNMKGELFGKIKSLKSEVNMYRDAINELREHNTKLAVEQTKKLKQRLKAQKVKAVEEGNGKMVAEIDDWLDEINQDSKPAQQSQIPDNSVQEITEAFNSWVSQNPWYMQDNDLREEADSIGLAEAFKRTKNQRALSPDEASEIYGTVTKKIHSLYPEKFGNPNKTKPSQVNSTNSSTASRGKTQKKIYSIRDIPEEYQAIARKFERSGALSVNEYAQQLKQMGVL